MQATPPGVLAGMDPLLIMTLDRRGTSGVTSRRGTAYTVASTARRGRHSLIAQHGRSRVRSGSDHSVLVTYVEALTLQFFDEYGISRPQCTSVVELSSSTTPSSPASNTAPRDPRTGGFTHSFDALAMGIRQSNGG